ncbi:MAG TPA: hypothetical protein VGM30_00340 [Puia sp.]|jgi:hypothetical protein
MSLSNSIGSLGVALLLVAYFLNLFRYIRPESRSYAFLNILGAGLSCYASVLIHYWPFVILESIWCGVALTGLVRKKKLPAE